MVLVGAVTDEHVNMISCHLARDDVQLVFLRDLAQHVPNPHRHLPSQDAFAILGAPDEVNLEVILCMTTEPISSHNATSSTLPFA